MFTHLKQTVKLVTYSLKWGKKEPKSSSNISQEDISFKKPNKRLSNFSGQ